MPCKPRMSGCAASCLHRQLVENYQVARHNDELRRESATAGYDTEMREYGGPMVTFRQWLVGHRRPAAQEVAAA